LTRAPERRSIAAAVAMYRNLDPEKIVETCRASRDHIAERFPDSGLSKVAGELLSVSEQAAALSAWLSRPHLPLRTFAGIGIVAVAIIVLEVILNLKVQATFTSIAEFLQGADAAINEVVFLGVTIFFFITLETRLKRRRAIEAVHVLRSIAHIIDMHQLTKDPEIVTGARPAGGSDVKRALSPAELIRYLDFCTDELSLISKIAALYIQKFSDPVTLSAVNEVENLTNGLSRKIWQKIMISDRILAP
jgi:hypothetical protein